MKRFLLTLLAAFAVASAATADDSLKLLEVRKIWDKAPHNAFTDLVRFKEEWFCVFREGKGHVSPDGSLRVLASKDGQTWESAALLSSPDSDLRDAKIVVTPDGQLMLTGAEAMHDKSKFTHQSLAWFSKDGRTWTPQHDIGDQNLWLWRTTWHKDKAYGLGYSVVKTDQFARLYESTDGKTFTTAVSRLVDGNYPNESSIVFAGDTAYCLLRRDGAAKSSGLLGIAKPPYKDWEWKDLGVKIGGPHMIQLPSGKFLACVRLYDVKARTSLCWVDVEKGTIKEALPLPSGGDTSYAGMVLHDGVVWVSYYSSHEGKTSIYLAKAAVIEPSLGEAKKVGSQRELFVDEELIASKSNVELQMHQPVPRDVALVCDAPWEGNISAYYTIFQDGDLYRMYYRGAHYDEQAKKSTHPEVTCYAESRDGLTWTKPKLGLFEFGGSKENNIVWAATDDSTHNFTVFRDVNPKCPPESRYKALAGERPGLRAFHSPDGIHWTQMQPEAVITKGAFDSQNLAFWDPNRGKYVSYHRFFRNKVRDVLTATSDDFIHWTDPVPLEIDGPAEHLYTNAIQPYARAPQLYVGFPTRFQPKNQQVEPILMTSRDGMHFHKWAEPLIPITAPQDRDGNRSNYMTYGLLQLPGDKELTVYGTEAYYAGPGSRLRRFTFRADGFVSLHAGTQAGEVVTHPLTVVGRELSLNLKGSEGGRLRVELQDAEGKPLPGFTLEDCTPLTGDAIDAVVQWKGKSDVSAVTNQPVRLRFALENVDLYAFQFVP